MEDEGEQEQTSMEDLKVQLDSALPHMAFVMYEGGDKVEGDIIEGYYKGEIRLLVIEAYVDFPDGIGVIDRLKLEAAEDDDDSAGFYTAVDSLEEDVTKYFRDNIETPDAKKIRRELN